MVVDLPRCGPMLSPRVPNLVPIPGPRMERETPGQHPRPNYGHPHPPHITRTPTAPVPATHDKHEAVAHSSTAQASPGTRRRCRADAGAWCEADSPVMAFGHGTVVAVLCSPDTASRVSRASEPQVGAYSASCRMRRRLKQPWKPQQRSGLDKRDPRLPQMCSNAISNVQHHSGRACLPRSENYAKVPPEAPSHIFAFGFAELSAALLGTAFRGADGLAARRLGCPRGVGAGGGCARARRSRRSVTAGPA